MKLFRFIKNVWDSFWNSIFDEDAKDFVKHIAGAAAVCSSVAAALYLLGLVGKQFGWMQYLPPDSRDSVVGLGAMMFGGLFIGLVVILALWGLCCKLKDGGTADTMNKFQKKGVGKSFHIDLNDWTIYSPAIVK